MNRLFWIFVIVVLGSCSKKNEEIPAEIIARDSMISILADIHIAEARVMNAGPVFRERTLKSAYLRQVLSKSNVESSRFLQSFEYYSQHPEIFSVMYEQVMVEISKRQAEKAK